MIITWLATNVNLKNNNISEIVRLLRLVVFAQHYIRALFVCLSKWHYAKKFIF